MPMTLNVIQYNANPLGALQTKKPNMNGIINCIDWFICACCGSIEAVGGVIIFVCKN